jgi:hypothetical protein
VNDGVFGGAELAFRCVRALGFGGDLGWRGVEVVEGVEKMTGNFLWLPIRTENLI